MGVPNCGAPAGEVYSGKGRKSPIDNDTEIGIAGYRAISPRASWYCFALSSWVCHALLSPVCVGLFLPYGGPTPFPALQFRIFA